MSCTLATAALCLSGLYLDVQVIAADNGVQTYAREIATSYLQREGLIESASWQRDSYSHEAANPYVRVALGMERPLAQFRSLEILWRFECFHESSVATGRDRGVNGCGAGVRAYPFGVAR